MKRNQVRTITVLTFFLLAFAVAAQQSITRGSVPGDLDAAAEGWKMIESGALLIDVRSDKEYAGGHIENSTNIPHTELDEIVKLIGPDKDRPVVLYCRSGNRSGRVTTALEGLGYTAAFNATGWEALEATRPAAD